MQHQDTEDLELVSTPALTVIVAVAMIVIYVLGYATAWTVVNFGWYAK